MQNKLVASIQNPFPDHLLKGYIFCYEILSHGNSIRTFRTTKITSSSELSFVIFISCWSHSIDQNLFCGNAICPDHMKSKNNHALGSKPLESQDLKDMSWNWNKIMTHIEWNKKWNCFPQYYPARPMQPSTASWIMTESLCNIGKARIVPAIQIKWKNLLTINVNNKW